MPIEADGVARARSLLPTDVARPTEELSMFIEVIPTGAALGAEIAASIWPNRLTMPRFAAIERLGSRNPAIVGTPRGSLTI